MDVAMNEDAVITINRVEHPKASVRLCDLPAGGDYFQRLWLPIAGPSVVALVNRSQELTRRAGGPIEISAIDLAESLGIPGRLPKRGAGIDRLEHDRHTFRKSSPLLRTLTRAQQMGVGRVHVGVDSMQFDVFDQVAPIPARQIRRLPEFLRQDHWDAMVPVAARFAKRGLDLGTLTDVGPGHHEPTSDTVHRAVARLEQLRTGPPTPSRSVAATAPSASL
jgi:hypothetical protein